LGVLVWFFQSDGFDQKTLLLYVAPASREDAWRTASRLTMGMPQIAASPARRFSMRC
jgi:hypothetical protein